MGTERIGLPPNANHKTGQLNTYYKASVLVDFRKESNQWLWIMKSVVAEAIEALGWNAYISAVP